MALTQQQFDTLKLSLEARKKSGVSMQASSSSLDGFSSIANTQEPSYLSRVGSTFKNNFSESLQSQKASMDGTMNPFSAGANIAKNATSAILSPLTEAINPILKPVVENTIAPVTNAIIETPPVQGFIDIMSKKPELSGAIADTLETGLNVSGIVSAASGVRSVVDAASKLRIPTVPGGGAFTNIKQKLIDFVAPDADEATQTMLKKSTPAEIDKIAKIQEAATKNPEAITPYEYIGDKMAQATKQLDSQRKAAAVQKSTIINKAKYGLEEFSKQTGEIILKVRRLGEGPVVKFFIEKLKTVKNKLQADKIIDELQDTLYRGNRDMTIPSGSSLDKQLKGLLGEYNTSLKASLPKSYAVLNAKMSNLNKVVNSLNRALGEVVDGVSTRGGSLVKQFFSPNGRKAKEIFEYVKNNTGIDLAKDATLSRYIMELYGDPRVNTLLGGGIPTSVSGVTNKIIDFAVEKTGLGTGIQNAQRAGAINKAKTLTQPK